MKLLKILIVVSVAMLLHLTSLAAIDPNVFQMNIDQVFMHEPGDYSVAYTTPSKVVVIERINWCKSTSNSGDEYRISSYINGIKGPRWLDYGTLKDVVIVADVSHGEPMYVKCVNKDSAVTVYIHIHSATEISGGEWSTGGKHHREQQTVPVE
jgi:hypothetical protein